MSKFDRYVARTTRDESLAAFILEAEFVVVMEQVAVCRDPKDNLVLDAAINGAASVVVTGDDDLLTLNSFQDIAILTPAQFLARA